MPLAMTADDLQRFMARAFAQVADEFTVEMVEDTGIRVRLDVGDKHLRPGGTVSGPTMFALADVSIYLAILSQIGEVPLAVTTNATIDFMRKPAADRPILCDARLLKLGRSLAVGDTLIYNAGAQDKPLARASMTYAIPPGTRDV